jgi:hypothetical protein
LVEVFYNIDMKTVSSIFSSAMVPFSTARNKSIKSQTAIVNGAMTSASAKLTILGSRSVIPLVPALFYGENLYSIPQDEVGKIIDVTPMKRVQQGSLAGQSVISGTDNPGANFPGTYYPGANSLVKPYTDVSQNVQIEYRNGVQYLNIRQGISNAGTITLSNCDDATDITASLDASNLELNSIYARENSSIDFDLGFANLDGKIVWGIDSLDISGITRDGTIQASVFIPEDLAGKLTNLTMAFANEVGFTNTATMVATSNAFGGTFSYGWQPVRFNYRGNTEAGTFVETAITHFSIDLIHTLTTAVTGVKIDSVKAYKGLGYELHFYNQKHFQDTSGTFLTQSTKTDDKVIIENSQLEEIVIQECRKLIDFELRGDDGGSQYSLAERALNGIYPNAGLYEMYKIDNPSNRLPIISNY